MSRVSSSSFLRSLTSRTSASIRRLPSAAGRVGRGRQLHPDGALIGAAEAQQIVGDRAVGREPLEQRHARLRIDEAIAIERPHVGFGRFARVAEDQLEVGVGGDGRGRIGAERPDVHAFVDGFEQPRERRGALIHAGIIELEIWLSGHLVIWSLIGRLNVNRNQ